MKPRLSILMYHQVGDFRPMPSHRSTYCHYKRFAAQMRYLRTFGYTVMSFEAALRALRGERAMPARAVVLTFDDGYENFYEYAFPVLQRYRFPAMVYLLSGMLGHNAEWFARDGRECPALMDRARVVQLQRAGIDFGSHGVSHVKLAEVDEARMRDEVFRSKAELEALLDQEVRHFCYPYGSYNDEVVETARVAGYKAAVTCERAAATPGVDPLRLPRKAISYGDSLPGYAWKLYAKNKPKTPAATTYEP
jgi:peptidoglycan/xylan/chitin deacetylase (PgdA/CDA1 family)